MSAPAQATTPDREPRRLEVDLHLRDARELFTVDEFDPFNATAPTRSGVDEIKAAALDTKLPEKFGVTLYLPAEQLEQHNADEIRSALTRYCDYRAEQAQASIAALKREAIIELRVGAAVLGVILLLALVLSPLFTLRNPLAEVLTALLTGALVIALWVVVWAPIETFFIEPLPLAWERRFYTRLPNADLTLRAESPATA